MLGVINIVILNIIISSLFSYFLAPWIKDIGEKLKILDIQISEKFILFQL